MKNKFQIITKKNNNVNIIRYYFNDHPDDSYNDFYDYVKSNGYNHHVSNDKYIEYIRNVN